MRKTIKLTLCLAVLLCSCLQPQLVYAWGDSDGGRPSYTTDEVNNGALGETITFNSISDNPALGGDEKNFVGARRVDSDSNVWNANTIAAEDGERYYIRMYVHNNNPGGDNALAKDTAVRFDIAEGSGTEVEVQGFITSSNASPAEYYDSVRFTSDTAFHLEYVPGSAFIENNGIAAGSGMGLSDEIVETETGVLIGYDVLDGNFPGGYPYVAYVGIEVRVVYDYSYIAETQVRLAGDDDAAWQKEVSAGIGDEVEFQIAFQNLETLSVADVMAKTVLPEGLEYVDGTMMLYNSVHPQGFTFEDGAVLFSDGINTGSYDSKSNFYLRFIAKVVDTGLSFGENTLVNWGQIGIGSTVKQDSASVVVRNDLLPNLLGVILLGAAVTSGIIFVTLRVKIYRQKKS
ncbi:MAG TPA: hypothetical protein H9671_07605 [Firmicutes bacterium]|nr:hypothetical protein [Bacillota bacterium]